MISINIGCLRDCAGYLLRPAIKRAMPPTSAPAQASGGNDTKCVLSFVAWIGPMLAIVSLLVYVKPPQASPITPAIIRTTPSTLFITDSLQRLKNCTFPSEAVS